MSFDTLQLWAEIWDATYTTRIGEGPIRLVNANGTQEWNGPGIGAISTIPMHPDFTIRALDLLNSKVIVAVWVHEPGKDKRLVVSFVADEIDYIHRPSGIELKVTGPSTMNLLTNTSTLLGREYSGTSHSATLTSLLGLAGWTLDSDGVDTTTDFNIRFDGQTVLKAVQFIAEYAGYRMRESDTTNKELVVSDNENDNGLIIGFAKGDSPAVRFNESVLIAEDIEIIDDSRDVVNWIIPVGAGDGDSAVTLESSTRTSPYTIQTTTGPDGRTIYYLSDSTSITNYGQIERKVNFKQIAPLGASAVSRRRAANLLYDAAAEWLTQHKDPQQTLRVTVRNLPQNVYIGDKLRVHYVETVNFQGTPYTLKNINALFWVIKANESIGHSGAHSVFHVSTIDRPMNGDAQIIVGNSNDIEVTNIGFKPTYNIWTMGPYEIFAYSRVLTIYLNIPEDVLAVSNVTMIVDTFEDLGVIVASVPNTFTKSMFNAGQGDYPVVTIDVNGDEVVSSLGSSSAEVHNQQIDITDEILAAGDDGRGDHVIEVDFLAGSNRAGGVNIQFMIRGEIITGRVT